MTPKNSAQKHLVLKEPYVTLNLNRELRSVIARLRTGTLLLMIEIGRFQGISIDERLCPFGCSCVEDETHFLFYCPLYEAFRNLYYENIERKGNGTFRFNLLSLQEKLCLIFEKDFIRLTAKFISDAFKLRLDTLYNNN